MIGNWTTCTISDCCEILDSLRIPLNSEERNRIQGSIPYYGANGVQGFINKFIFDEDLILMAEDGGNFEQFVTRPIAYKISGKSWVNNHAHILKAKAGFDQDFVFYSIVHKNILFHIQGGTRSKLNQSDLKSISIEIPKSKIEQITIATILTTIDLAIEKTEQLIAKYERIKTGLMQDLLTRGIDEKGNIRSEETHEFKDSVLGRIPKEWEVEKLGILANFISGKAWSTKLLTEHGKKIIRISNLHKPDFPFWHFDGNHTMDAVVKTGDILFSWAGVASSIDCDQYFGEPALLNQHIYNLKFNNEELKMFTHRYIKWFLPKLRKEIEGGAGQLHLTKSKIQGIKIPFPKHFELEKINNRLYSIDSIIDKENNFLIKLNSQKKGLMQDLLTGKVKVNILMN